MIPWNRLFGEREPADQKGRAIYGYFSVASD
jgi:hypothetical protein